MITETTRPFRRHHPERRDFAARPSGIFTLRAFRGGRLIEESVERNLVVDGIKEVLASLLGAGTPDDVVSQIGFGIDGTAPIAGNVGLTDPFLKEIGSVSHPATGEVQFDWELETTENNGVSIREFGLFTVSGGLVARKARLAAIRKEADVSLEGSWIIAF